MSVFLHFVRASTAYMLKCSSYIGATTWPSASLSVPKKILIFPAAAIYYYFYLGINLKKWMR